MLRTPWGDADTLRERKLLPRPGTAREAVDQDQRERLFAAMVAEASERGYAATTVEDLIGRAGVSRNAFYAHFSDKEDCFLTATAAMVEAATALFVPPAAEALGPPEPSTLTFFLKLVASQPAAARLAFVETYAAGPEAIAYVDWTTAGLEEFIHRSLRSTPGGDGMPRAVSRAVGAGLMKVIGARLRRGEEDRLVDLGSALWEWTVSYRPPPRPLRRVRRSPAPGKAVEERLPARDRAERIIDAAIATFAREGYRASTIAQIAKAAQVAVRTFYLHFEGTEDVLGAALDRGGARMLATIEPAARRAKTWPESVRAAIDAMLASLAAEPQFAAVGVVEAYSAGRKMLERRDRTVGVLQRLLDPGYGLSSGTPPIAAEAIGGAIDVMIYDQIRERGAERLEEIAPLATYIALAPFLDAAEACDLANNGGTRR